MSAVGEHTAGPAWQRHVLPVGAVAAVLLWLAGVLVIEGLGDTPDEAGGAELVRYFSEDEVSLYVGGLLFTLGSLAFLWWSAALRAVVAAAEGALGWLAAVVFGSAVAVTVFSVGFLAPQIGGAFAANESDAPLEPGAAQALWYAGDGFFVSTAYAGASLAIAFGLAAWRFRLLPTWALVLTGLIALVQLIPVINWIGVVFGIPLWVLLVGLLVRREATARPAV